MTTDTQNCGEEKFQRLVDQVIVAELSPEKWQALRTHLAGCASCRARYDRAVLAERMLHGGPNAVTAPSPGELDRIARAVLPPERTPAWARLLQWFSAHRLETAGALAAAAAAVLIIPLVRAPGTHGEFQPRGGKGPVQLFSTDVQTGKVTARSAGLRAFCIHGEQVRALDPKSNLAPPACERSDQMKLAVSNTGAFGKVFLFGLDDEHDIKWYAPRPPETDSVVVPVAGPEQQVDVPVGASVRLGVNHRPGTVRIYALFSDRVVTANEVQAATDDLAKRHVKVDTAETLPLKRTDVLQRSLLIDVEP
jgi:hypothetical protein